MIRKLGHGDYLRARWKNGLGYTDQIAIFPENADLRRGDFLWRVSTARIEQSAEFSTFANHDRFLVLIAGGGLLLTHTLGEGETDTVELPSYEVYEFPGDLPSRAELLGNPVTDLSVFVRKEGVQAGVEMISIRDAEPLAWRIQGRWNFAFAAQGAFTLETPAADEVIRVDPGETLMLERGIEADLPEYFLRSRGGAAGLVLIRLSPA